MKSIFFAILSLFFGIVGAQSVRDVGSFSHLKVYDRISAEIIQSNQNKVEIIGDQENIVEVVNKNGELKIRTKTTKFLQGNNIQVKIFYTRLNSIQASQGASISSKENVQAKRLNLTSNEGSKIHIGVDVNFLDAKANSGGEISITGKAENQNVLVNSGAIFSGEKMESENAKVTANAGGTALVYASEAVTATVRAGGNIEVFGNPKQRDTKKVIGGSINFE